MKQVRVKGKVITTIFPWAQVRPIITWASALDAACDKIKAYSPDALVVSLGVDTYENDPDFIF